MTKTRFPRAIGLAVAKEICQALQLYTERLEVAGSLRRRKADVGDVELLFVPRMESRPFDMFTTEDVDLAGEEIDRMVARGLLAKRPNIAGGTSWGTKNRLAVHVETGCPVDLFTTTHDAWWNYLVCRTGPAASARHFSSPVSVSSAITASSRDDPTSRVLPATTGS
jgi:DNA polymerase/3'-5' exonuclease PolX